jgi:hypothetical protein
LYSWWLKDKHFKPTPEQVQALLKREFALQEDDGNLDEVSYYLLLSWITQILPIAAGNVADWGPNHYLYMTVQQGHFPGAGNENKLYIPPSTEAFAAWIIENNMPAWIAQWEAKEEFGDFPVKRLAKDENNRIVTMDESRVS